MVLRDLHGSVRTSSTARTMLAAAIVLPLAAFGVCRPATAARAVLWDDNVLVRVSEVPPQGQQGAHLTLQILTADLPNQPLFQDTVSFTTDGAYDGQPTVGIMPGKDVADRLIAMVWVREDVQLHRRDLALVWMTMPSLQAGWQWLTRTAETEQDPRIILDSRGTQHVLYRTAEDGHLHYLLRDRDGGAPVTTDISRDELGGSRVGSLGYDIAFVDSEPLIAAALDDGTGTVVLFTQGTPPGGGETIPVPLLARTATLSSSGSTYAFSPGDPVPTPRIHIYSGVPVVTWTVHDSLIGADTLLYRYRTDGGGWSDWSRLALDTDFGEEEALEVVAAFLRMKTVVVTDPAGPAEQPEPGTFLDDQGRFETVRGNSR